MFKNIKIKKWELKDLTNKTLLIKTFTNTEGEITIAIDKDGNEMFLLNYHLKKIHCPE